MAYDKSTSLPTFVIIYGYKRNQARFSSISFGQSSVPQHCHYVNNNIWQINLKFEQNS